MAIKRDVEELKRNLQVRHSEGNVGQTGAGLPIGIRSRDDHVAAEIDFNAED